MGRPRKDGPLLRQRGEIWFASVLVDGKRIERSTGQRDETEATRVAESWTQDAAQAAAQGQQTAPRAATVTLNDVLSELLDDCRAKIRNGNRSEETYGFYEQKAAALLAFYGHTFDVGAWSRDSRVSWDYIRWRRSSKVTDSSIKKELGTLRTALYLAQEQGLFTGNQPLRCRRHLVPRRRSPSAHPRAKSSWPSSRT